MFIEFLDQPGCQRIGVSSRFRLQCTDSGFLIHGFGRIFLRQGDIQRLNGGRIGNLFSSGCANRTTDGRERYTFGIPAGLHLGQLRSFHKLHNSQTDNNYAKDYKRAEEKHVEPQAKRTLAVLLVRGEACFRKTLTVFHSSTSQVETAWLPLIRTAPFQREK